MKSFASALLAAGAYAAAGAIDFSIEGTVSPFSFSLGNAKLTKILAVTDNVTAGHIQDVSGFTYAITTAVSSKQYKLTMTMVGANSEVYTKDKAGRMELFQCWKNGTQSADGLKGLSCAVFTAA